MSRSVSVHYQKEHFQYGRFLIRPAEITPYRWEIYDTIDGHVEMGSNSYRYLRSQIESMAAASLRAFFEKKRQEKQMGQELALKDVTGAGLVQGAMTFSALEKVVAQGNLAELTSEQRLTYYRQVCESLGLNPFTRPFEYVNLQGKLTLYARKDATDQLRRNYGINLEIVSREKIDDLLIVTCRATTPDGRSDEEIGAVNVKGLAGEPLANAMMKAITKAKRRVTLSIVGLGWMDESQSEGQQTVVVDHTTGEIIDAGVVETENLGTLCLETQDAWHVAGLSPTKALLARILHCDKAQAPARWEDCDAEQLARLKHYAENQGDILPPGPLPASYPLSIPARQDSDPDSPSGMESIDEEAA